jgi:synaptosomal-associated protein 29
MFTLLQELVQQGEQLDNVETKLDTINRDMKTSQKHLDSIKSVFGGIKNWWHGKDKQTGESSQPQKTNSQSASGLQKALDDSINAGVQSGTHPAFRLKTDDGRGFYEEDDLDGQFLGAGTRRYDQTNSNQRNSDTTDKTAAPLQQKQAVGSGLGAADEKFDENLGMYR